MQSTQTQAQHQAEVEHEKAIRMAETLFLRREFQLAIEMAESSLRITQNEGDTVHRSIEHEWKHEMELPFISSKDNTRKISIRFPRFDSTHPVTIQERALAIQFQCYHEMGLSPSDTLLDLSGSTFSLDFALFYIKFYFANSSNISWTIQNTFSIIQHILDNILLFHIETLSNTKLISYYSKELFLYLHFLFFQVLPLETSSSSSSSSSSQGIPFIIHTIHSKLMDTTNCHDLIVLNKTLDSHTLVQQGLQSISSSLSSSSSTLSFGQQMILKCLQRCHELISSTIIPDSHMSHITTSTATDCTITTREQQHPFFPCIPHSFRSIYPILVSNITSILLSLIQRVHHTNPYSQNNENRFELTTSTLSRMTRYICTIFRRQWSWLWNIIIHHLQRQKLIMIRSVHVKNVAN